MWNLLLMSSLGLMATVMLRWLFRYEWPSESRNPTGNPLHTHKKKDNGINASNARVNDLRKNKVTGVRGGYGDAGMNTT